MYPVLSFHTQKPTSAFNKMNAVFLSRIKELVRELIVTALLQMKDSVARAVTLLLHMQAEVGTPSLKTTYLQKASKSHFLQFCCCSFHCAFKYNYKNILPILMLQKCNQEKQNSDFFLHAPFHSELKKTPKFKPKELEDSNYTDLCLEKGDFALQAQAFTHILINASNADKKDQSTSKMSTVTPSF